jgi:hypothetical protein
MDQKFLAVLVFLSISCKIYKKDFDNPVDYQANSDLGISAPALVFYPKTQTININDSLVLESVIVFHKDSIQAFSGAHLRVHFPSHLIKLDTILPGLFITDTSQSIPLFTYTFDGENSIDIYTYFLSEIKYAIEGTGHIADIIFTPLDRGIDSLYYDLNYCEIIDVYDDEIEILGRRSAEVKID